MRGLCNQQGKGYFQRIEIFGARFMNNSTILLVARILLSVIFILAGLNKFGGIDGTAGYIASKGLPMAPLLAWATAILEVVAGAAILVGFQTRIAAWALAAFCVAAALIFHNTFVDPSQYNAFMKNLAIAGGLLALSVSGPGALSVDGRKA
jgi:putative oxidoreductase